VTGDRARAVSGIDVAELDDDSDVSSTRASDLHLREDIIDSAVNDLLSNITLKLLTDRWITSTQNGGSTRN